MLRRHFVQICHHDLAPYRLALVECKLLRQLMQHAAQSFCNSRLLSNANQPVEVTACSVSFCTKFPLNDVKFATYVFVNMQIAPDLGKRRSTCRSTRSWTWLISILGSADASSPSYKCVPSRKKSSSRSLIPQLTRITSRSSVTFLKNLRISQPESISKGSVCPSPKVRRVRDHHVRTYSSPSSASPYTSAPAHESP